MQYAILIYESPAEFSARSDPERQAGYWGGFTAYVAAINEAGINKGGEPLLPPETATTLRLRDGKRVVQDGPYADAKEQLGGLMVIDVPDLDAALDWAAKCPAAATGAVEVRPVLMRGAM